MREALDEAFWIFLSVFGRLVVVPALVIALYCGFIFPEMRKYRREVIPASPCYFAVSI